jgi:hypothetical protein
MYWPGIMTMAVLSGVFVLASGKNVAIVLFALMGMSMAVYLYFKTSRTRLVVFGLFFASVAAMLSPIDVDIRRGNSVAIRTLPIVYIHNSYAAVRRLERQGKLENVDFIVVRRMPWLNDAKYSAVIQIPW